jgi:hypothetical protein
MEQTTPSPVQAKTDRQIVFYDDPPLVGRGRRVGREAKESSNHMWFDTWEECHDWMVGSAMIEMKNAEVQLGLARIKLSEIQSMQKPEVE